MNLYQTVVNEFTNRNCILLTTKDEFFSIKRISNNYKLKYIASCGHEHSVFYNVFKYRKTGVICPSCINTKNAKSAKEQLNENKISKIEQELNVILLFKEILENEFDFIKSFDGCKVDIIIKPKYIEKDEWVGIQVKTTQKRNKTYGFCINNNYRNCLILLYSIDDNSTWLIPENIIGFQKKISIGYVNSKYDIYKIQRNDIKNKICELYNATSKFSFLYLNTPINYYQLREQEFRHFREEKIKFIKFIYPEKEGTVYDFNIEHLKIQEKVCTIDTNNVCKFCMYKNNGSGRYKGYDFGDNDFYWLNSNDKKTFFVIPENILIYKGIIGNNKKYLKITIKNPLDKRSAWLTKYMFNYDSIDKYRLLELLQLNETAVNR